MKSPAQLVTSIALIIASLSISYFLLVIVPKNEESKLQIQRDRDAAIEKKAEEEKKYQECLHRYKNSGYDSCGPKPS